jgi:hypothetical protein
MYKKENLSKSTLPLTTRALDITTGKEFKLVCLRLIRKGISRAHFVNREQKLLPRVSRIQQIESVFPYTSVST